MNDTSFGLSDSQKSPLAVGHFNGQELPTLNFSSSIAPGGGLLSTISDMLKFLSANIGLIKTKLNDAMKESQLIRHGTTSNYLIIYKHQHQVTRMTLDFMLVWDGL